MKIFKIAILFLLFFPGLIFAKPSLNNIKTYANVYKNYTAKDLEKLKKFDIATIDLYDIPNKKFTLDLKKLKKFDIATIEPYGTPNKKFVQQLRASGTIVLGYLDIGEAEEWRKYFKKMPRDLILKENPNWQGDYFVNVNDSRWHKIILDQEIPYLMSRGHLDGLMLDMLDVVDEYPNLKPGIISLVKKIRKKYPDLLIVPNRGFTVLPQIAPFIDAIKYEAMCASYDYDKEKYVYKNEKEDQKILFKVLKKHKMPVLVLDHLQTSPKNIKMAKKCFKQAKEFSQKTDAKFVWYGNSMNQDLPIWSFLPFKQNKPRTLQNSLSVREDLFYSHSSLLQARKYSGKVRGRKEFQKGMNYPGYNEQIFLSKKSDKSLTQLSKTKTEYVALVPVWYQKTKYSSEIYRPKYDSPSDKAVLHAIDKIHFLGMQVVLRPFVDSYDGTWRAQYEPRNFDKWFESYTKFILHFAKMAEEKNVASLNIGAEYNFAEPYTKKWKQLIKKVRKVYSGDLTYGANFSAVNGKGGYQNIKFWSKLDYIGLDAYFPLTDKNNPTLSELEEGWQIWLSQIEEWRDSTKIKKPIIFTEIGYGSYDGINITPWAYNYEGKIVDQQEQADCYEAFFRAVYPKKWLAGVYFWAWDNSSTSDFRYGGQYYNFGFTPNGKLAEKILKKYYK